MSTSLLYHVFGVRDYRHVGTKYVRGGVIFRIERKMETCRCAACDSENIWRQGVVVRRFRTVPIGGKGVELEARIPRLGCQDCGVVRQAAIGFAEPRRSYTKCPRRNNLNKL
jgi:transposase